MRGTVDGGVIVNERSSVSRHREDPCRTGPASPRRPSRSCGHSRAIGPGASALRRPVRGAVHPGSACGSWPAGRGCRWWAPPRAGSTTVWPVPGPDRRPSRAPGSSTTQPRLRPRDRRVDARRRRWTVRRARAARPWIRPLPRRRGRGGLMPKVSDEYRDARRRSILDAAITCFERRGLHGTTTDDIAAEAGLSNGALYRYFDGKAAIVEAIAAQRHARSARCSTPRCRDDDPRRRGARLRRRVLRVARRSRRAPAAAGQRARVGRGARRRAAGGGGRRRGRAARDAELAIERHGRVGRAARTRRRRCAGPGDPGAAAGLRAAGGVGSVARRRPLRGDMHRGARRLPGPPSDAVPATAIATAPPSGSRACPTASARSRRRARRSRGTL